MMIIMVKFNYTRCPKKRIAFHNIYQGKTSNIKKTYGNVFVVLQGEELSPNCSKIIKKITIFSYVGGRGGVKAHMEISICLVIFIFEGFPN